MLFHVPADGLSGDTAQSGGMRREEAISGASVGSQRLWMGRTTVAEGVETADQFHRLRGIGVDAYQGWLFSKAVPAAELRQLLAGDRVATPENVLPGL